MDIVERLREIPVWMVGTMTPGWQGHGTAAYEAADEIGALRERLVALHEAMADVMMLRRISETKRQSEKANAAINVWQEVQSFLAYRALGKADTPVSDLQRQEYDGEAVREAFLKGWDACWCRKANAPFERDGGRQSAWEKYRGTLAHPAQATPLALSGDAGEGRTCPMDGDPCSNSSCLPGICFLDSPGRNRPSHKGAGE